jgi:hypothetical protein
MLTEDDFQEHVLGLSQQAYGDRYRQDVLDLYKMFVASADKISDRRQTANAFFLTLNSTIIGLVGYLNSSQDLKVANHYLYALVPLAGMLICYMWLSMIRSYRNMNSGKFQVINVIEKMLPIRPYDAEWIALGRGQDSRRYLEFSQVEKNIPVIFFLIHLVVLAMSIYQAIYKVSGM